ncbi:MAG: CRISPR-associated protein Cas4 [Chloroflexota bacterium]
MSGRSAYAEEDLLPLSGIQHFAFCRRQWALIHIERQWAESARTVEGHHLHERAHNPLIVDDDDSRLVARAVALVSHTLGLSGQADVVEFLPAQGDASGISLPGRTGLWQPRPVEYKRGRPKPDDRDAVQLCAQAICLEEMLGVAIPSGDLYYGATRRRERVTLDSDLRQRVGELAEQMHALFAEGRTPRAEKGKHCQLCSMADLCHPNLTIRSRSVTKYIQAELNDSK